MLFAQADSLPAFLAEKVDVGVFVVVGIVIVMLALAKLVKCAAIAALDNMYKMVSTEQIQCAQYVRFVDSAYCGFQIGERHWVLHCR